MWPDILAAAAARAADAEQARKDELKRQRGAAAVARVGATEATQLDSKAGKRREFGRVMWKVTSQEINDVLEGLSADLFEFIYARGGWVKGYTSGLAAAEEAARLAT